MLRWLTHHLPPSFKRVHQRTNRLLSLTKKSKKRIAIMDLMRSALIASALPKKILRKLSTLATMAPFRNALIVYQVIKKTNLWSMKALRLSSLNWNRNVRESISRTKSARIVFPSLNSAIKWITSALITNRSPRACVTNVSLLQLFWKDKHTDMLIMFHSWTLLRCLPSSTSGNRAVDAWSSVWLGCMDTIQKTLITQKVWEWTSKPFMSPFKLERSMV